MDKVQKPSNLESKFLISIMNVMIHWTSSTLGDSIVHKYTAHQAVGKGCQNVGNASCSTYTSIILCCCYNICLTSVNCMLTFYKTI
jgi:hypothetical protein